MAFAAALQDAALSVFMRDDAMIQHLQRLGVEARSADARERELAIIGNRSAVDRMVAVMLADRRTFQSFLDNPMRVVLDMPNGALSFKAWKERFVTNKMLAFLQGITIFASRDADLEIGRPAYHRFTSCGPYDRGRGAGAGSEFERDHMTCHGELDAQELERRRRNVWTCLVERLAYASLYEQIVGPQDIGHDFNEERMTRELFERCFAANRVAIISVRVIPDGITGAPLEMTITYSTPTDRITETFVRTYVGAAYELEVEVRGSKAVTPVQGYPGFGPGDEYRRSQSYLQDPGEWMPVSPGRVPVNGGGRQAGRGQGRRRSTKWLPNRPGGAKEPWMASSVIR